LREAQKKASIGLNKVLNLQKNPASLQFIFDFMISVEAST